MRLYTLLTNTGPVKIWVRRDDTAEICVCVVRFALEAKIEQAESEMRRFKVAGSEHQQNKSSTLLKKRKIKNSRRSSVPFHLQQTLVTARREARQRSAQCFLTAGRLWGLFKITFCFCCFVLRRGHRH